MKYFVSCLLVLLIAMPVAGSSLKNDQGVQDQITLLETWIEAQMSWRSLPGLAISIVYDQELVWAKGFGVRDLSTHAPMETSTIFRIASITKTFTSTAIMQLRDAGKLRLDDPITTYLPWFHIQDCFPDSPPITIRHLLTHTSGLPREAAFPYWTDHHFPTVEQIKEALPNQQTIFARETHYKYSNLGMALLGYIVEVVSGESYATYIQDHIFIPLQMTSSSVKLPAAHRSKLTTGYGIRKPDGTREISPFTDAKGLTPAANISSTVLDLAKFAMLQFLQSQQVSGKQILKASTLREMQRVHWLKPNWTSGRGLGFSVWKEEERTFVGHGGWVAGNRTQLLFCPDEKIAVIVMTNADDGIPNFYAERAYKMVAPAILRAVKPPEVVKPADPAWQVYVGTYTDPWGWDTKIFIRNNQLVMYGYNYPPEEDPEQSLSILTPEGPHSFRDQNNGERVIFEVDDAGAVVRVKTGENYIYPKDK